MTLYIDCEFNGFLGELVSMALIDTNGNIWYEVLECFNPTDWMALNVIPVLNKKPIGVEEFQSSLADFLKQYSSIHLVADWCEDITHFCQTLILAPGKCIDIPSWTMEVRRDIDAPSMIPHNALEDAKAIRIMALEKKNYRLLVRNEIIEKNDEMLLDDCIAWEKIDRFIGNRYDPTFFVPIRRKT
jgi:hypothetical protein